MRAREQVFVEGARGRLVLEEDGLLCFRSVVEGDDKLRAFLPHCQGWRRDVIFYAHRQAKHAGAKRLAGHLGRSFGGRTWSARSPTR